VAARTQELQTAAHSSFGCVFGTEESYRKLRRRRNWIQNRIRRVIHSPQRWMMFHFALCPYHNEVQAGTLSRVWRVLKGRLRFR
jgi:hypothetical protein